MLNNVVTKVLVWYVKHFVYLLTKNGLFCVPFIMKYKVFIMLKSCINYIYYSFFTI